MNLSEELYIFYRRIKAALSWLIYFICSICPIHNNKIVFSAFEGGGYGCNPKYIAEEIIRRMHEDGRPYELVWLVNNKSKVFPAEITAVKNNLWNRAYHLATAKIWVDNARKNFGTRKREGQFYIQTWHGPIGFKPIGSKRGKALPKIAEIVSRYDSSIIDCIIANSQWQINNMRESFFYDGVILVTGSPRCDSMLTNSMKLREDFCQKYNIPQTAKILMYAPTFRAGSQHCQRFVEMGAIGFDYEPFLAELEETTNKQWYLVLRLHPQAAARYGAILGDREANKILDLSQEPDVYDILSAIDVLVTDYSSLAFDACYKKLPVFLYATDVEEMTADRGGLLWNVRELPFPFAKTEEELLSNITSFDKRRYEKDLDAFFQKVGLLEDGKASLRVVDFIIKHMNDDKR